MARSIINIDRLTEDMVRRSPKLQGQLLALIANRYNRAWTFVQPKRKVFRERQRALTKPETFLTDHIKIYTALQQRKAFIATYKNEEFTAEFKGRELGDDVKAHKLNLAAAYDADAMGKSDLDYPWLSNIHDYGVGIRISTGWDDNKKLMKYDVVNPEFRLPDPQGNSIENNFEYHMFLMRNTLEGLHNTNRSTANTYFNLDKVATSALIDDMEGTDYAKQAHRLLSRDDDGTRQVGLLNTYIEINHRKYLVTTSNSRGLVIRFKEIEPETSEERKNPSIVPFPVNITNVIPIQEDPFGIAPLELIIDKQGAQNRLMNLALIQEQQNTFKKYLVDPDVISNLNMLGTRTDNGPIYIPASTSKPAGIGGAISEIPDHQTADGSKVNLSDKIDMLIQEQTGFTDLNRGIGSPNMTATEAQIQTVNSNLQLSLDGGRIALGEKDFWLNMRYRSINVHLTETNKKIFRIQSGIIGRTVELKKSDLISGIDPDVTVISQRVQKNKNRETMVAMQANLPLVIQDPSIPIVSKNIYKRKLQELSGMDKDLIRVYTPLSSDETRALAYVDMLNNDIKPESLFRPGMDLLTYWVYFNQAEDTDAKNEVLAVLEDAMAEEGLNSPQQPAGQEGELNGTVNSMASQQVGALIGDQKQQAQQQGIQGGI